MRKNPLKRNIFVVIFSFIILNSYLLISSASSVLSVDTIVEGNYVKFKVKSEKYLEENISIKIVGKNSNSIKYIDQGKISGKSYTFSTKLEAGEYVGTVNTTSNIKSSISSFKVERPKEEDKENSNKPNKNPSNNHSKPGSISGSIDYGEGNDGETGFIDDSNTSFKRIDSDDKDKKDDKNKKDKSDRQNSIKGIYPIVVVMAIAAMGYGYQSFKYKD